MQHMMRKLGVDTIEHVVVFLSSDYLYFPYQLVLQYTIGNMQTSQGHFTTIVYAKFGGKQSPSWGNVICFLTSPMFSVKA